MANRIRPLRRTGSTGVPVVANMLDGEIAVNAFDQVIYMRVGANLVPVSNYSAPLGFTPVQQGGGAGQSSNKIYIGWSGDRLKASVDATDLGNLWYSSNFDPNSKAGVAGVSGDFTVQAKLVGVGELQQGDGSYGWNLVWNLVTPGQGASEYINNRQGGSGGHNFYSRQNTTGTPILSHSLGPDGRSAIKNANSTSLTTQPRIFVQGTDPGAAAAAGDLWFLPV